MGVIPGSEFSMISGARRVRLRTVSLPHLCGAQSAPYCRVYAKTGQTGNDVAQMKQTGTLLRSPDCAAGGIWEKPRFLDFATLHPGYSSTVVRRAHPTY